MDIIKRRIIKKHIEGWERNLKNRSIESFAKSGRVSGSFLIALSDMMDDYAEQCNIADVVKPKGTLPLDKLIKGIEEYELGQQTHPIERTPERMRTILAATHWCKEIAKRLAK